MVPIYFINIIEKYDEAIMIVKESNTHNTIKTQKQVKTGLGRTHLLTDMHKTD